MKIYFQNRIAGRFLVDAIVGKMSEDVMHLGALVGVLVGCEPDQSVIIEVDSEGVHAGHQDVESQVKLGLVDKIGSCNISNVKTTMINMEGTLKLLSKHIKLTF